jgi:hypothetical protein
LGRPAPRAGKGIRQSQTWIYPLSLAVYCTSWTFFGSVGLASRSGFDFLAIYIGPMLLFALFWPLIRRVVRIAKAQNITSIADFIGARYGKSQAVAGMVCLIVTVGTIPYVALQLKAVSSSLMTTIRPDEIVNVTQELPFFGDLALVVAVSMAAFAMLFGTRHADATEHQDGLILAVAGGVHRQARLLPRHRPLHDLRHVRRLWRPLRPGALTARHRRLGAALAGPVDLPRHERALLLLRHPAAAHVPRRRGGEPFGGGDSPRVLALPALPRPHQPLRRSHRGGGTCGLPAGLHGQRHDGGRAADVAGETSS